MGWWWTAAWGQTTASIDCVTNAACRVLHEQAAQQSKSGQLEEAEKSYKLAYQASHDERLLFNIARVLDKRGQWEEAKTYYSRFLESKIDDESQKAKAREYLGKLELTNPPLSPATVVQTAPIAPPLTGPTNDERRTDTPAYKKGWFWGVVAGSVAVVGLGIGLGVGLGVERGNRIPTVPDRTNTMAF